MLSLSSFKDERTCVQLFNLNEFGRATEKIHTHEVHKSAGIGWSYSTPLWQNKSEPWNLMLSIYSLATQSRKMSSWQRLPPWELESQGFHQATTRLLRGEGILHRKIVVFFFQRKLLKKKSHALTYKETMKYMATMKYMDTMKYMAGCQNVLGFWVQPYCIYDPWDILRPGILERHPYGIWVFPKIGVPPNHPF